MKINVYSRGSTEIDADSEYQEPEIREAIDRYNAGGSVQPGDGVTDTIIDLTDTERSDISHDHYAIVTEADGTELWRGWLTGDPEAPSPVASAASEQATEAGLPAGAAALIASAIPDLTQMQADLREARHAAQTRADVIRRLVAHWEFIGTTRDDDQVIAACLEAAGLKG